MWTTLTTHAVLILSLSAIVHAADRSPNWETATVISQDLGAQPAGAYEGPYGGGRVALPVYRRYNVVVVETEHYRYQWQEQQTKSPGFIKDHFIVLAVNDTVQFYRDGKWFVVLDAEKKKHKFGLMGATKKE